MAAGVSTSLSDSSLLLSESSLGLPVLACVAVAPAFPGSRHVAPFPEVPLAEAEAALTCRILSDAFTWLGVPAEGSSSLLSGSSFGLMELPAGVRAPPLTWGVTSPTFPGIGVALLAGDSLAGTGEGLTWAGFAEGFTSTSVSSLELEVSLLELLAWPADTGPGLAVAPKAWTLPSSSVSETKTVFPEGSADFLGDFPERRWTTAFLEARCGTEFTVLLGFLVFALAFSFMLEGKSTPVAEELLDASLGAALAVLASASSSSSSSELSELLMGSDTRVFLACRAASSSAFRFRPSSEVCCQCV